VKRISGFAFGTFFLLCAAVVAWASLAITGPWAVKRTVESAGTDTLGQDVSVENASLSMFGGTLRLSDLRVANPPGYQDEIMIHLDSGVANIDVWSLLRETVIIRRMELDGVVLIVEQRGLDNNLHEVMGCVRNAEHEGRRDALRKQLRIDSVLLSNVRVRSMLSSVPGGGGTFELALGPIEIHNLGHDEELSLPVLVGKLLQAIASGAADKGLRILPDDTIGLAGKQS